MSLHTTWNDPTSPSWMGLSARLRGFISRAAARRDLIVRVTPQPLPAPAMFVPALAEVRVAAADMFEVDVTDPDTIDPEDPHDRELWPHLMGAAAHEAAHAAHTHWVPPAGADPEAVNWAVVLEEPRIEARLVSREPKYRRWLRASAAKFIITANPAEPLDAATASRHTAVRTAVLALGRVQAGVLRDSDVQQLWFWLNREVGGELLADVADVVADALACPDGDAEPLLACGARLKMLVGEAQPPESGEQGQSGDNPDPSGAGQCTARELPCGSWTPGDLPEGVEDPFSQAPKAETGRPSQLTKMIKAGVDELAKATATTERGDDPSSENLARASEDRQREAEALRDAAAAATSVFRDGVGGRTAGWGSQPIVMVSSDPDSAALSDTRQIIAALRSAAYRGTDRTVRPSLAPPGRLSTGQLMQRAAQTESGLRVSAQPWKQTVRRETVRPRLRVGLSVDVSGSMDHLQQPVARIGYALAHAIKGVNGTIAGTAWNSEVAPTFKPGVVPSQLRVPVCGGGSGGLPLSLKALDGQLNLTGDTRGARLITIITDGYLSDTVCCASVLTRLHNSGVTLLVIHPSAADTAWLPSGVHTLHIEPGDRDGLGAVGQAIGAAVVAALQDA